MSTDIYYSGDDFKFDYQFKNANETFIDLSDTEVIAELRIQGKTVNKFQGVNIELTTIVIPEENLVEIHLSRNITNILPKSYRYELLLKLKGSDDKQITWDVYKFEVR